MTVVVRDMKTKQIKALCKGADSIILELVDRRKMENIELEKITNEFLEEYATEGLRTLLIAEKNLTEQEYQEWNNKYQSACMAIKGRDELIDKVALDLEHSFDIVGSTAIEDKLQDEVDTTIASLKEAGIKVWVLTGDKIETAINIGYSCKLLSNEMVQS